MSLNIHTSNRMEQLVAALGDLIRTPLSSPFAPEILVVQSKGMQRWLAMQLAQRFGVWANCSYPFPNKIVRDLFATILPDLPDSARFSPPVMTWRIMGLLPDLLGRREFAPLAGYLEGDTNGLKRFQLAGKIADTFDQYTMFRPDLLLEWESGKGDGWQENLWRRIASPDNGWHRGRIRQEFGRALARPLGGEQRLPERITVFGISYLPAFHLDIFTRIARHTDVNLFLLSPCRQFWGDILSARSIARRRPEERDYLVEGNPLLASLGKLARDFSTMVIEAGSPALSETELYQDPGHERLLQAIQSDILNLRGEAGSVEEKRPIRPEDRSVQIHSCHGPLREIEILHDNLLDLLAREQDLTPRDIIVMTPDIETYAPYISMVFGGSQDSATSIPYSIADRTLATEGQIAHALLKLLALPGSRLSVALLLDILESPPVSRRFGLEPQELETVRRWIEDTRIRWGMDREHRASLGFPAYDENSWRAGLDRLLLGYAMPEEDNRLFRGIAPYDGMEGSDTRTLGRLADFIARVEQFAGDFAHPRTLAQWRESLATLLEDFFAADDDLAHELAGVSGLVQSLEELEAESGFSETLDLAVIRAWLSSRLGEEERGFGFMTGGVTFCAMLPMRSIPFKVVALIGMNDGAFPRQSRPPGFDLIAHNPRPGDRSLRDEDRYLFLECLLSARRYLYLSYVGQSIRDNSPIPPSVLISELLDAINAAFVSEGTKLEHLLVTSHRLQAFSRSYFDGSSRLFSYSAENCAALRAADQGTQGAVPFLSHPLPPPGDEARRISLDQLVRFYANPARHLVEQRLLIRLTDVSAPLEEREPFALEGLEAYGLAQELLERRLRGEGTDDIFAAARCRGILPPARHGERLFAALLEQVDGLAQSMRQAINGRPRRERFSFDEPLGAFRLHGSLDGIWEERKISCRCAKLKARDEIRVWIEHLALNAFAPRDYPRQSLLIMKDGSRGFAAPENPSGLLLSLLEYYWQGLRLPLKFFPASSLEFAASGQLKNARRKWESAYLPGEEEDPYFQLCFPGEGEALDERFQELAHELLTPLVRHRR